MASRFVNHIAALSAGLRSGGTFVAALGAAGLLTKFTHAPVIFDALVTTLITAGITRALGAQEPFEANYTSPSEAGVHVVSFVAAVLGLWGVAAVVPPTTGFVCEPLVPWHVSIAIFGAFGMSWLAAAVELRNPHMRAGLMIHLAFFWISPFYGFFHVPWFLAQAVALPCDGRPFIEIVIVGVAMMVASLGGRGIAKWMVI